MNTSPTLAAPRVCAGGRNSRGVKLRVWIDPETVARLAAIKELSPAVLGAEPSQSCAVRLAVKVLADQLTALNATAEHQRSTLGAPVEAPDALRLRLDLQAVRGASGRATR